MSGLEQKADTKAWSWVKPMVWQCPRCLSSWLVTALSPVCARCGFKERT